MTFLGVPVRRGEVVRARVPVGELLDGTPIAMPVATIGGTKDGPTLYVQAGLHGDEQTGIEVGRQVLHQLDPAKIAGTVVCVPVANLPAHLTRTRGFLHEERWLIDINRIFPGNPQGLVTERIADVLFNEFVRPADFSIDLHAALDGCDIAPFAYLDPDDDTSGTLALRERVVTALGTPYVYRKAPGSKLGTSDMTRSLTSQADALSKATTTLEMGESRRVSWGVVPIGVRGVFNAMKVLGLLEGEPERDAEPRQFSKITPVHVTRGGGVRMRVDLRDEVSEGDVLGEVVDVFGDPVESITAPSSGFILRVIRLGAVNTGAEAVWIGR